MGILGEQQRPGGSRLANKSTVTAPTIRRDQADVARSSSPRVVVAMSDLKPGGSTHSRRGRLSVRSATGDVIVGLDVGTTGVKAVAFDLANRRRTVAIREYPLIQPSPGQQVQDPAVIIAGAHAALCECLADARGSSVLAISLSAAMHGLIALDDSCRPITALITWADERARTEAIELASDPAAFDLQAVTGTPVHPMTPLVKLEWFRRNDPATFSAARWWVGLKDYLIFWLTGILATETSSASGTGLLDVTTRTWSPEAMAACGIDQRRLPEILPTTAVLPLRSDGPLASSLGLEEGTPVAVGAADGPLANLGSGAVDVGIAGMSLGTSGAIRVATDGPRPDRLGRVFSYALVEPLWVAGGAISNGAEVLRWAARTLSPGAPNGAPGDPPTDPTQGVADDSGGVVMLPFLLAERPPIWNPELAGAFVGLRHHHTEAHMRRAAMEGVCIQMRLLLDRVSAHHPVTSIRATGGAFRSPLWKSLMAAALERPMTVTGDEEGTALGAAAVGLLATGYSESLRDAAAALERQPEEALRPEAVDPSLVKVFGELRSRTAVLVDALAENVSTRSGP